MKENALLQEQSGICQINALYAGIWIFAVVGV